MKATSIRLPITVLGLALATVLPGVACSQGTEQVDTGVDAVIFMKRAVQSVDPNTNKVVIDVAGGNGQVLDYERYVPGGSSSCSRRRAPGRRAQRTSRADFPTADFNGADVSFDAKQVVFSMKTRRATTTTTSTRCSSRAGADGKFEIHQKTGGDHDDINPIYLAGRPHRVRDERDVHGDGHARRRVRARPRRHAARDDLRRRRRRRSPPRLAEPLAHRRAVPPLRRQDRLLALGAPRRRQRREALRGEPRRHADARASPASTASRRTRSSACARSRRT